MSNWDSEYKYTSPVVSYVGSSETENSPLSQGESERTEGRRRGLGTKKKDEGRNALRDGGVLSL